MLTVSYDPEKEEHVLVGEGGDAIPIRDDVWERLRDPNEIFSEWKKLLQKWAIHVGKAGLLKDECPAENDYRTLRTAIRVFERPA